MSKKNFPLVGRSLYSECLRGGHDATGLVLVKPDNIESKDLEGQRYCPMGQCGIGGRPHLNCSSSSSFNLKSGLKDSIVEIESQDDEGFVTPIPRCSNDSSLIDI